MRESDDDDLLAHDLIWNREREPIEHREPAVIPFEESGPASSDYPLACTRQPCGTQADPWNGQNNLTVLAAHMNQWAQRTFNGTCGLGTYSRPVTILGLTQFKWVQQTGLTCPFPAGAWCPAPN
jgi:hypothetical protein